MKRKNFTAMLENDFFYETESYFLSIKQDTCVWITWKLQISSEKIKEGLAKAIQMMQGYSIRNLVSDLQLCQTSWVSSNEWITSQWLPKALSEVKLSKVAFICGHSLTQRLSLDNLKVKLQKTYGRDDFYFNTFSEEEKALEWILN